MTPKELQLFKRLISYASSILADKSANDIPDKLLEDWSEEDKLKFRKYYYRSHDGNFEEFRPLNYDWWALELLSKEACRLIEQSMKDEELL